jgi:hypothetical protein
MIDEAHHFIVFRRSYMRSTIRKKFMKALKERKSEMKDKKCDIRAGGNNSAVSVPGPAAETEVSNKNTYDKQRPDTECTPDLVYLKTCLRSEIDPSNLVVANPKAFITSSESSISFPPSIYYLNRSSDVEYHQRRSDNYQVVESKFYVGECFGSLRVEKFDSGWNVQFLRYFIHSCMLSKDGSRNFEHHFNIGWLAYTKRGVFGFDGSFDLNNNLKSFESYPRGDQIKSNKFNREHPLELVGYLESILI